MAIFEAEGNYLQNEDFREHLNRNWSAGNDQFDAVNKQILDIGTNPASSSPDEVAQARMDVHGNTFQTLKGREDAQQITAENALSVASSKADADYIQQYLSQMSYVPETFANLAALQTAYPTGKAGLFIVADTGHKYIWINNVWTDAGIYQSAGISDADAENVYSKIKNRFSLIDKDSGNGNGGALLTKVIGDMGLIWNDIKPNPDTMATDTFNGIAWHYDLSKLANCSAKGVSKLLVDLLAQSDSQTDLQINVNYYSGSTLLGSSPESYITLVPGKINHINKAIRILSYPNITDVAIILMHVGAVTSDFHFQTTEESITPLFEDRNVQYSLFNWQTSVQSNITNQSLDLSIDSNNRKNVIVTKTIDSGALAGVFWRMYKNDLSSAKSLELIGQIESNVDAEIGIFFNYRDSNNELLRSLTVKQFYLTANQKIDLPSDFPIFDVDSTHIEMSIAFRASTDPGSALTFTNFDARLSDKDVDIMEGSLINSENIIHSINMGELSYSKDSAGLEWFDGKAIDTTTKFTGISFNILNEKVAKLVQSSAKKIDFHVLVNPVSNIPSLLLVGNSYDENGALLGSDTLKTFHPNAGRIFSVDSSIPINKNAFAISIFLLSVDPVASGFEFQVADVYSKPVYLSVDELEENDSLPVLKLSGSTSGMSHDVANTFSYESSKKINIRAGYLTAKWQGDSSLSYPKKNLSLKLFSDPNAKNKNKLIPFNGWQKDSSFVLKANYIDATQARNLVNSQLFSEIVANRKSLSTNWIGADNFTQIKGKPVHVFMNEIDQGLFTFNTKKSESLFNMDDDNADNIAVSGEVNGIPETSFKASSAKLDGTDFSMEQPGDPTADIQAKFNRLMAFINESSDTDYQANEAQYLDVPSFIDYLIFISLIQDNDGTVKNVIYATWDGNVWSAIPYDLDTTWGLMWNGSTIMDLNMNIFDSFNGNKLFSQIMKFHKSDILARYAELRANVLSASHIIDTFKNFMAQIDESQLENDQAIWPAVPSIKLTNFDQIRQAVYTRTQVVDQQIQDI
ncbi:hypothetical protein X291_02095 [Oenococcus oeni IOEB_C23]|uniref:CotH kinase family protein n=1 Tax=Oenococcus oeni TaxID=1247 RepID=UPI00050DF729|nr:CotH kinase family protein [Oenococcus oeni]KGH66785.1 hypothetical protein X291_02095 [Oenococcus oeni IOEB_C23]